MVRFSLFLFSFAFWLPVYVLYPLQLFCFVTSFLLNILLLLIKKKKKKKEKEKKRKRKKEREKKTKRKKEKKSISLLSSCMMNLVLPQTL